MLVLFCFTAAGHCSQYAEPEKVAEVLDGKRETADASWWGFDEEDSTVYMQAALDSGVRKVIFPDMGSPWIVSKITLNNDGLEVVFEPGVLVLAKEGAFRRITDAMFTVVRRKNIVFRGYGAVLRMRKMDYIREPYEPGEHRHIFDIRASENIQVLGLRVENSGKDGVYIRGKDIVIRDVVADGNHSQGISVTHAENLLIENTVLKNTSGTSPMAGLDLEPNREADLLN